MSTQSWAACQRYLTRLGAMEYAAGISAHAKTGKRKSTYRHNQSQYHRDLVAYLGDDDEQGFKALKGLQGYASEVRS